MTRLLLATRNRGKLREYRSLLADLPFEWVLLQEVGLHHLAVPEIGATFEENARLKAVAYARASGLLTLADDSGLEVDALGGGPGVRSARYAGARASDAERTRKLLAALEGEPDRAARFRCVVAIATPAGEVQTAEGVCVGRIGYEPRGEHGFGYDPVFVLAGREETMAQLPVAEKNAVSHRARALAAARPILARLVLQEAQS
jgi:XTP/dITP diphosphohydrolase